MPQLRIGIQLECLRLPFKQALHTAARLGASGVEIDARTGLRPQELSDTGRRQLRKMLDDLNLRVAAIRFLTRRGYDVADDLDKRMEATKLAMRFAHTLGASVVVNQIGVVPEDPLDPSADQLRSCLCDLARYGQHVGAVLAAETGAEPGERLASLLGNLQEPTLGIAFNPGNLILNGFSAEQALQMCAPWVVHVCSRDAVRDLARKRGIEVALGQGSAEFPEIIGRLEERQYRGWYIVDRDRCDAPVTEVGYAIQYLQSL